MNISTDRANSELIKLYPTIIDASRLDPQNFLITPISRHELTTIVKKLKKNKAPGHSKINKLLIMSNLPIIMITILSHIYNAALSCELFPDKYKKKKKN